MPDPLTVEELQALADYCTEEAARIEAAAYGPERWDMLDQADELRKEANAYRRRIEAANRRSEDAKPRMDDRAG